MHGGFLNYIKLETSTWYQSVIADHRGTKGHQSSEAIVAENSCPEVTKVVSSSAEAKESDTNLAKAHTRPSRGSQELRRASERPALLTQRARRLTQGLLRLTQTHSG